MVCDVLINVIFKVTGEGKCRKCVNLSYVLLSGDSVKDYGVPRET